MPVRVAVLDANVSYSIEHTDVPLTLASVRAVRVHWSSEILDEVRRNLAVRPDLSTAAIDYRIAQMNRALPDALAEPPGELSSRCQSTTRIDMSSRLLHIEAAVIVTSNLRDFLPAIASGTALKPSHPTSSSPVLRMGTRRPSGLHSPQPPLVVNGHRSAPAS